MKYSYGKKELLEEVNDLVNKLCKKEEEAYNKNIWEREEKYQQWMENCKQVCEKYKQLPDDWWKQFVEFKEVTTTSGFIFNKTKLSEEFNDEKANDYLRSKGVYCCVKPNSTYPFFYALGNCNFIEKFHQEIATFETKRFVGNLFTDDIHLLDKTWVVNVLENTHHYPLLEEHSKNYYNLKEIQSKIESVPENVSEIILEDHDIEVIKIAKMKVE